MGKDKIATFALTGQQRNSLKVRLYRHVNVNMSEAMTDIDITNYMTRQTDVVNSKTCLEQILTLCYHYSYVSIPSSNHIR